MTLSTEQPARSARARLGRLAPWLLIGAVVVFHAANNWIWLVENVTSTGWDKPRHLAYSLNYAHLLSSPGIRSLFSVMVSDPVRPPLFAASAAILYWLFGYSADVATMVNVIYMAVALAATYGAGYLWASRASGSRRAGVRLGLVSALLLAFLPMFYAMSRYFYLEFGLTAMVALTVYLLLASDGFRRRGASLLFGLSLGLGLLTKRTFFIFALGPVLVIVITSGLLPALWRRLRQRYVIHWRSAMLATLGGLALAAAWYLPNRDAVGELLLGHALFFLWWALAGLAIYFATLPSAPLANALSALLLGAGLASLWYLANVDFVQRLVLYGYGVGDPRGRQLRLDSVDTYLYYLRKLGNEHLSIVVLALLFLVGVAALLACVRRHRSIPAALRAVRPEGWAILAWLAGSYLILTLSIYQETRAFTPALPAVALLAGAALLKLPWRRARLAVGLVLGLFLLVQFFVVSYEPIQRLLPPAVARLPGWGRTTSFAQGVYIQLPDEGDTDRGYWIVPDVLARMEAGRQAAGLDQASLGLLVNTSQVNAGPFNYLMLTDYPALRVESLVDAVDEQQLYRGLFGHEFIAVDRLAAEEDPPLGALVAELLTEPPALFARAFELVASYDLPDGDTVYLYGRRDHLPAGYPVEYATRLAQGLADRTRAGDALLITPPALAGPLVAGYEGPAEVYLLPLEEDDLADVARRHDRVFLAVGDAAAGEADGSAQAWLDAHAFRASHEWADSLQLLVYGPAQPAAAPSQAVGARFDVGQAAGGPVELAGYSLPAGPWQPGDVLPLTLFWRAEAPVAQDYQVFVHLLDADGKIVAQNDAQPAAGRRPASGWAAGEAVVDPHGVLLEAGSQAPPPGEYRLYVGLYLPSTGERLSTAGGTGTGDSLYLGSILIVSSAGE